MSGGGILLGLGIGAALVGITYAVSHAIANAELAIDDMFGDWPHLGELAVDREAHGGDGGIAADHLGYGSHSHDGAL